MKKFKVTVELITICEDVIEANTRMEAYREAQKQTLTLGHSRDDMRIFVEEVVE